jgi:hypothetical protein
MDEWMDGLSHENCHLSIYNGWMMDYHGLSMDKCNL